MVKFNGIKNIKDWVITGERQFQSLMYNVHVSCSAMSQTIVNAGFYMVIQILNCPYVHILLNKYHSV